MSTPFVSNRPPLEIPDGFFADVAALLDSEAAEEIAEAVLEVCIVRGILHPELDDDPADELRTEQIHEVFALLDAVSAAVADGTIVPSRIPPTAAVDPHMETLWFGFVDDASDPHCSEAVVEMIETGSLFTPAVRS